MENHRALGQNSRGGYMQICTVHVGTMDIHITVGEAVAVVVGELFSFIWYAGFIPGVKGRYSEGDRNIGSAIICGIVLALMIQMILSKKWVEVKNIFHVIGMAAWITVLYTALVAPHSKINEKFVFSVLHKFILLLLMCFTIHICEGFDLKWGVKDIIKSPSTTNENITKLPNESSTNGEEKKMK